MNHGRWTETEKVCSHSCMSALCFHSLCSKMISFQNQWSTLHRRAFIKIVYLSPNCYSKRVPPNTLFLIYAANIFSIWSPKWKCTRPQRPFNCVRKYVDVLSPLGHWLQTNSFNHDYLILEPRWNEWKSSNDMANKLLCQVLIFAIMNY